jgi:hypothetical protein
VSVTALAGIAAATWPEPRTGLSATWWARSILSGLVAVGILVIALPVAFGGAAGSARVDPVQLFSSDPLVSVGSAGTVSLSAAGMVPGESRDAMVRVANEGDASAEFSLATKVADRIGSAAAPLSRVMILDVQTAGGTQVYRGPIGQMPQLELGRQAAGGSRAYLLTVTLPRTVRDAVAGASMSASFAWSAG